MQGSFSIGRLPPARVLHDNVWWYFTGRMDTYTPIGCYSGGTDPIAEYETDRQSVMNPKPREKRWFDYDGNMAMEINYDTDERIPYTRDY